MALLAGKRALVVGVANAQSIATGCARAFRENGARLALTYLNDRARPHVAPVAEELGAEILAPLDVTRDAELDALFARVEAAWGGLDILVHSIAFCPKEDLHGRVTDCSREGFLTAMDVSVHSLIRMTRRAEPLMRAGGSILTVSYYGAEKVVDHYNVMGPVKAALEAGVRSLAVELGPRGIRVNTLSPGPVVTRAASGIDHFDDLVEAARTRAPEHRLVTLEEIGHMAAALSADGARGVTGTITFVDGGLHAVA
ncbi:short-chain dehydrogenase/reductase SDR [Methylobacterium sp. 4-46]|uniref:enoyl-ACP reductase FabI n=1 Tax=unclassified Methylobacterium TaxID=2615210 RepID=UPI000152CD8F|nr:MULTISPECIES: enoyl-ACP reductase FabI [Methylobacterium]ACA20376.1 short-chain dehydrogenase/reductase SDR [Methylobacterium sp. 4-46]WFT79545.1 enoyl-ACP reductase FabI [Methylobacterium nodulans]